MIVINRAGVFRPTNIKEVCMSWIVKGEALFWGMAMEKEEVTRTFQDEDEAREYAAQLIRDDYQLTGVVIEQDNEE